MDSTGLRLIAHFAMVALLLAAAGCAWLAHGRALHWRYYRLLAAVLVVFAIWFALLMFSIRGAAFISRETLTWTLALLETAGAVGGWAWLGLTVSASFRLERRQPRPVNWFLGAD